jgi:hypothetical protein
VLERQRVLASLALVGDLCWNFREIGHRSEAYREALRQDRPLPGKAFYVR